MKRYIISVDQSTSASKVMLVDELGKIVKKVSYGHHQSFPKPGWAEHDAKEILHNVLCGIDEMIDHGAEGEVCAIAISNQRETTVLWDRKTGEPLCPALVWQDIRAQALCDGLSYAKEDVKRITGLDLSPYYSAAKASHALTQYGLREKDVCMGTVDSFLIWHLSGGKVFMTDGSNAARTQWLNLNKLSWDDDMVKLFGIQKSMLPEAIMPSDHIFCHYKGIPVTGVMGDSHAALYGNGCHSKGEAKATYGTGSSVMRNTGSEMVFSDGLSTCVGFYTKREGLHYAIEGNVTCSADTLIFLCSLGFFENPGEIERLANTVTGSGGVQLIPAFSGLGAPYFTSNAKGVLWGLNRGTTRGEIAYAALSSIAQQGADILEVMGGVNELHADGGASKNMLLMQIQADLLGCPVQCSAADELSALGCAYLAGLTTGLYPSFDAIERELGRRYLPSITEEDRTKRRAEWKYAMEKAIY
ncbi:MAG: glycerol kinase [Clostridiales bacterium]|nr:glycerol kinase [Clostridiales bacterium]